MRDAYMVIICMIIAVAAIPVFFCVGYLLFDLRRTRCSSSTRLA